ncbi:MAG TPA: SDR family NAD(P)-dependent oxidoreductase, partial [Thermoanaerobaculia bacterium]|nr:SDR family NAD(P)-dependent oxidoreductase [Thermoanaerobaculia bacterium]
MTSQSLEGKVALITGASSGLGRGFAVALARAGAKVFLVARREEKLRDAVEEIAAAGGEAAYHVADVRITPTL